jgi:phosphoglycerate dehydrogenase-like enzyme
MKPPTLVVAANGADSLPFNLRQTLGNYAAVQYMVNREPLDPHAFIDLATPYDYLAVTRRTIRKIDRQIIDALPHLKGISVYSTGLEWVDQDCLRERGIRLLGLPDYCTNAVAESTLGLIFMAAHRLHLRYQKSIRMIPGNISVRGFELQHRSVGIIGFGKIGRLLAQKIRPLCTKVMAFDPDETVFDHPHDIIRAGKEQILAECDFVVCCAAQQFEPIQLLSHVQYALLRPETVVINVGRTSLLNHELLVKMVKRRQIAQYIYDDQMFAGDRPNEIEYGKIIPTGHTAWYTDEAMANGTETWINNLIKLCRTT